MSRKRGSVYVALVVAAAAAVYVLTRSPNPVRAVYPPDPSSVSPPGTEKFIVFSRDFNEPAGSARIWEYVPGEPGGGLTLRCEIGDKASGLIRLSYAVPEILGLYTGDLEFRPDPLTRVIERVLDRDLFVQKWTPLFVDYRTWTAHPLRDVGDLYNPHPGEVLVAGPRIYFDTGKGVHVLDRNGRTVETLDMQILRDLGWAWLVLQRDGPAGTVMLFDPNENRCVAPFDMKAYRNLTLDTYGGFWPAALLLSRSGDFLAGCERIGPGPMGIDQELGYPPIAVPAAIRVSNVRKNDLREFPVNLVVRPYALYQENIGFYWRFTDDGRLVYSSAAQAGSQPYDWMDPAELAKHMEEISVDLATGQVTRRPAPVSDLTPVPFARTFPYLPAYLTATGAPLMSDTYVAEAFLHVSGLLVRQDKACGVDVADFSSDGRRFLCKMKPHVLSGDFFCGNLETREWRRIPAPAPHLDRPVSVDIHWVRCR
jgi:hypothetical protein